MRWREAISAHGSPKLLNAVPRCRNPASKASRHDVFDPKRPEIAWIYHKTGRKRSKTPEFRGVPEALSACEKSSQWRAGLGLFQQATGVVAASSVMTSLAVEGRWEECLGVLLGMRLSARE